MRYSMTFISLLMSIAAPAAAVTEAQFDSITQLGRLNAVALHCQFLEQTRRMKAALVEQLPKRRELGLAFDEATNQAFIEFIDQRRQCPADTEFKHQVERAIERLKAVY